MLNLTASSNQWQPSQCPPPLPSASNGSNSSTNGTASNAEFQHLLTDYFKIAFYSVMLCIGAPFNCRAFWDHAKVLYTRKTPTRIKSMRFPLLRFNLVIANLFILLLHVPGTIGWMVTYEWKGGDPLCRMMRYVDLFGFYLSSNAITILALDSMLTIVRQREPHVLAYCRVKKMIGVAWLLAVAFSAPQFHIWILYEADMGNGNWLRQCTSIYAVYRAMNCMRSFLTAELVYRLLHLVTIFWIPGCITFCCYVVILLEISKHQRAMSSMGSTMSGCTHSPQRELSTYTTGTVEAAKCVGKGRCRRSTCYNRRFRCVADCSCLGLVQRWFNRKSSQDEFNASTESRNFDDLREGVKRSDGADNIGSAAKSTNCFHMSNKGALKSLQSPEDKTDFYSEIPTEAIPERIPTAINPPKRLSLDGLVKSINSSTLEEGLVIANPGCQSPSKSEAMNIITPCREVQPLMPVDGGLAPMKPPPVKSDSKRRANRLAASLRQPLYILTAYIVCWLPYNALSLNEMIHRDSNQPILFVQFLEGVVVLNSVINPFLYKFRSGH